MKSIVNRMLVVLMVGALTSVVAFAKTQRQRVTFDNDMKVHAPFDARKLIARLEALRADSRSQAGDAARAG